MASKARSPRLARFLSDLTLGFSDGLTVPFALTAGLSSLGRADTVIYAGLAELCAGSISMGIGGYLAARDEPAASSPSSASAAADDGGDDDDEEEELKGMLYHASSSVDEQAAEAQEALVRQHLAPLALPTRLTTDVIAALKARPDGLCGAARHLRSHARPSPHAPRAGRLPVWPVASGLSISLGYIVGGIVPLLPYFFAATVGLGLRWSIVLCLVALMSFGSGKSWLLRGGGAASPMRCLWEGLQMLVLGSLAAGASVLCVTLLSTSSGEPARQLTE